MEKRRNPLIYRCLGVVQSNRPETWLRVPSFFPVRSGAAGGGANLKLECSRRLKMDDKLRNVSYLGSDNPRTERVATVREKAGKWRSARCRYTSTMHPSEVREARLSRAGIRPEWRLGLNLTYRIASWASLMIGCQLGTKLSFGQGLHQCR